MWMFSTLVFLATTAQASDGHDVESRRLTPVSDEETAMFSSFEGELVGSRRALETYTGFMVPIGMSSSIGGAMLVAMHFIFHERFMKRSTRKSARFYMDMMVSITSLVSGYSSAHTTVSNFVDWSEDSADTSFFQFIMRDTETPVHFAGAIVSMLAAAFIGILRVHNWVTYVAAFAGHVLTTFGNQNTLKRFLCQMDADFFADPICA